MKTACQYQARSPELTTAAQSYVCSHDHCRYNAARAKSYLNRAVRPACALAPGAGLSRTRKAELTDSPISPRISVVVFSWNTVGTIERTLASAIEQGIEDLELLVLDGGSTDGTVDVIRRYEDKITFWRSGPDGGPTYAINEGVKRATGDVISLLPADDWLEPGSLRAVQKEFAADPELDVLSCGTRYVRFDADGCMHNDAIFVTPEVLEFSMEGILSHPLVAGRFIRKRIYERLGGHSTEFIFGDYDFLLRVCLSRVKSKVLPQLTYTYRRHPGSATLSWDPTKVLAMLRDTLRIITQHLGRVDLASGDRKALLYRHGRSSAHYAWRLFIRGHLLQASRVIIRAMRMNWLWPCLAMDLLLRGKTTHELSAKKS